MAQRSSITFDTFRGVDFTNSPANMDKDKSPNCVNMIRYVPGKIRKRMGYKIKKQFISGGIPMPINGYHVLKSKGKAVYHAGNVIYESETSSVLYSKANNARSVSIPFNNKLYILDGADILVYDGETCKSIQDDAYIPILTISKNPSGGGTDYEAINLLQPAFTELFLVNTESANATTFQLTFGNLDSTTVKAWVNKTVNGVTGWVEMTELRDFTVDRTLGTVTFAKAPGVTPVTGEDNVKITAYRTVEGYADRIGKCTICCLFGVNGAQDRLFVSGNPDSDYLNYDWFSQRNDPSYFADTNYCTLGSSSAPIMGYAIINNYLATFKGEGELYSNILIRSGDLTENKPTFPLKNTISGEAAIAKGSFQYMQTEPVFLTASGVKAITTQDISAEKYAQDRSFYLNGKMLKESKEDLKNALSVMYNDMYVLLINEQLYILDGIQPIQTDKSLPYATRQYAAFYCNFSDMTRKRFGTLTTMWIDLNGVLCLGNQNGYVLEFSTEIDNPDSYTDAGEAIEAIYETPDCDGKQFYKNKTFKYIAVEMGVAKATGVTISVCNNGRWSTIKDNHVGYFDFADLTFSKLTFGTNKVDKLVSAKIRVKKVDKTRVRLSNTAEKEPFILYNVGLEYNEKGNHR